MLCVLVLLLRVFVMVHLLALHVWVLRTTNSMQVSYLC